MNLIAGLLLLYMDEEQTLRHLTLLMVRRNLRPLFKPGFPGLQRCYFVWNSLLTEYLPELHKHFEVLNIDPSFYAASWYPQAS